MVARPPSTTAFDLLAGYLALDALVLNRDRHAANWAILRSRRGNQPDRLSPLFDNASGLCLSLSESNMKKRYDSRGLPAYVRRECLARPFAPMGGGAPTLFQVAAQALSRCGTVARDHWLGRTDALSMQDLDAILAAVPGMSEVERTFVAKLVETTRRCIVDEFSGCSRACSAVPGDLARRPSLFLFFADRLMNPRRPDFAAYVDALGLPPSPSELDLLSRSEGAVKGDRATVVEEPAVGADGSTSYAFVVRGVRCALADAATRDEVLTTISAGSHLTVRPEPENAVSAQALQLVTDEGVVVGWVPDALAPYVSAVLARPGADVSVLRRNGPEQPPHMRLVASIRGWLPPAASPLPQLSSDQSVSLAPA